jgi:tetratricopeptide (TPR) repeat protein
VLPHELAHAVARHAAAGPFGVPGKLFGLMPEPVLIEGTAVALEPLARGELTVDQWARAAHEAGVAPPLSSLLGPGFFGSNQALAYTLAGSFLRFVLDSYGADGLRAVYRSGDVERSLQRDFASLERDWKAALQQVPLSAHAAELARLRFERPSVLAQVCPHEVAALGSQLSAALAAGDLDRAGAKCREILDIDPHDTSTRATLASTLARLGDFAGAQEIADALSAPPRAPWPTLTYVHSQIADARYAQGNYASAAQGYRELLQAPQGEDQLRQLEVKLLGLSAGDPARQLIQELMVADNRPDSRVAMHLIHALYAAETGALAPYLEARQLLQAERHDLALPLLRQALEAGLPGELLRLEALRIACLAAFVQGSLDEAEAFAQTLRDDPAASLADQALAQDYLARIAFRR